MNIVKTVEISLKDGRQLTLEMSDTLLTQIKSTFGLTNESEITDRHVKYYLTSAMKNTLEKFDDK